MPKHREKITITISLTTFLEYLKTPEMSELGSRFGEWTKVREASGKMLRSKTIQFGTRSSFFLSFLPGGFLAQR